MTTFFSDILTDVNNGVIVDSGEVSGNLLISTSTFAVDIEPQVGDIFMFCDIPSSAKIKSLRVFHDDLSPGLTGRASVGIYAGERIVRTDGTLFIENEVIQEGTFLDDSSFIRLTAKDGLDIRYHIDGIAFQQLNAFLNAQLQLWQLAGAANLPEDPFKSLRIGIQMTEGFSTFVSGTALMQISYTGKN